MSSLGKEGPTADAAGPAADDAGIESPASVIDCASSPMSSSPRSSGDFLCNGASPAGEGKRSGAKGRIPIDVAADRAAHDETGPFCARERSDTADEVSPTRGRASPANLEADDSAPFDAAPAIGKAKPPIVWAGAPPPLPPTPPRARVPPPPPPTPPNAPEVKAPPPPSQPETRAVAAALPARPPSPPKVVSDASGEALEVRKVDFLKRSAGPNEANASNAKDVRLPKLLRKMRHQQREEVQRAKDNLEDELRNARASAREATGTAEVNALCLAAELKVVERMAVERDQFERQARAMTAEYNSTTRKNAQLRLLLKDVQRQLKAEQERSAMLEAAAMEAQVFDDPNGASPTFIRADEAAGAHAELPVTLREWRRSATSGYGLVKLTPSLGRRSSSRRASETVFSEPKAPIEPKPTQSGAAPAPVPRRASEHGGASALSHSQQKGEGKKPERKLSFGRRLRRSLSFG